MENTTYFGSVGGIAVYDSSCCVGHEEAHTCDSFSNYLKTNWFTESNFAKVTLTFFMYTSKQQYIMYCIRSIYYAREKKTVCKQTRHRETMHYIFHMSYPELFYGQLQLFHTPLPHPKSSSFASPTHPRWHLLRTNLNLNDLLELTVLQRDWTNGKQCIGDFLFVRDLVGLYKDWSWGLELKM